MDSHDIAVAVADVVSPREGHSMNSKLSRLVGGAAVALALVACGSDGDSGGNPHATMSAPGGRQGNPATLDLTPCADGYAGELNDTIQIAYDFEKSAHEMVVCGGANVQFAIALVEVFVNVLAQPGGDPTPQGFRWDGDGTYHVDSDGFSRVSMDVQVSLDAEYSFGNAGEVIAYDLFDADSYLVGASVAIDYQKGPIISFDSPGPLVELLGLGSEPQSPIVLSPDTLNTIGAQLRKLRISSAADLYDDHNSSEIAYQFSTDPQPAAELAGNSPFAFKLIGASGSNVSMSQTMTLDVWAVNYSGAAELDGTVDFRVEGGPFDFKGQLSYEQSGYADITLSCL
jgi:hypothetical protein